MKKGDVYFVNLTNTGASIQTGNRPCVIVQNDKGNQSSPTTIVVPITSVIKRMYLPTHVLINDNQHLKYTSMALCEQVVTVSKSDINDYITTLDDLTMRKINSALLISLGII